MFNISNGLKLLCLNVIRKVASVPINTIPSKYILLFNGLKGASNFMNIRESISVGKEYTIPNTTKRK